MRILNKSKGTVLSLKAEMRRSLWGKARGLMFSRHRDLVFEFPSERLVPLHMLFVFHPIDVIYIDSRGRVVEIREHLQPWAFHSPRHASRWVIELQAGRVSEQRTRMGDTLILS